MNFRSGGRGLPRVEVQLPQRPGGLLDGLQRIVHIEGLTGVDADRIRPVLRGVAEAVGRRLEAADPSFERPHCFTPMLAGERFELGQRDIDAAGLDAEGVADFGQIHGVGEPFADALRRDDTDASGHAKPPVKASARTRGDEPANRRGRRHLWHWAHPSAKRAHHYGKAEPGRENRRSEHDCGELQKPDHRLRVPMIRRLRLPLADTGTTASGAVPNGLYVTPE